MSACGPPSRLNPFGFVSDTGVRFLLLIVFVTAADTLYWRSIAFRVLNLEPRFRECMPKIPIQDLAKLDLAQGALIFGCLRDGMASYMPFLFGGLALLAAATAGLYAARPSLIERRGGLVELGEADPPDIAKALNEMVARSNLRPPPRFLWNPLLFGNGMAYGSFGRRRVGLAGALALQVFTKPKAFRVVILHELAHIRNKDLDQMFIADSILLALVLTALLPNLAVGPWNVPDMAFTAGLTTVVAAVVLLTYASLVRARELYADARAASWSHDNARLSEALKEALKGMPAIARWRRMLSLHPDPARRLRLLESTDELFRFGSWDAFGLGLAVAIVSLLVAELVLLVGGAFHLNLIGLGTLLVLVPSALVLPFGVAVASVITWRSVFLAVVRGSRPRGVVRTSAAFAVGLAAGVTVSLFPVIVAAASGAGAGVISLPSAGIAALVLATSMLAMAVLLAAALTAYLSWVAAGAMAWMPVLLERRERGREFALGIVLTCVLAVPWFSVFPVTALTSIAGLAGASGGSLPVALLWVIALAASTFPINLVCWPSMIVLWAWPLAAGVVRRAGADARSGEWAWLGSSPVAVTLPAPLRPGRAITIGLIGGFALSILLLAARFGLPPEIERAIGAVPGARAPAHTVLMVTAMAAQALVAFATALSVPRLRTTHALFAANIAGFVLALAVVLHIVAIASVTAWQALLIAQPIIFGGFLLALVASSLVRLLLAVARWDRSSWSRLSTWWKFRCS